MLYFLLKRRGVPQSLIKIKVQQVLVKWTTGCFISGCVLSMGNAMKTLAQHLHRCALDRLGCVSISGVRTSLCIGLANPLRSSCNARNATFYNTAMGLIAISFFFDLRAINGTDQPYALLDVPHYR